MGTTVQISRGQVENALQRIHNTIEGLNERLAKKKNAAHFTANASGRPAHYGSDIRSLENQLNDAKEIANLLAKYLDHGVSVFEDELEGVHSKMNLINYTMNSIGYELRQIKDKLKGQESLIDNVQHKCFVIKQAIKLACE